MKIRLSSALGYTRLLTQIASALFVLMLANPVWAQTITNYTNFPMMGLVRGQTLQVNLVAIPIDPCFATIGFQNANGSPVGPTLNVALQAGQSASLALNGNTLTNTPGQRVEVLPTVVVEPGTAPSQCDASAEIYDNILEISSVLVQGVPGFPPSPIFGMFGVTELQTAQLNVVAFPTDPCIGTLSFVNSSGVPVGNTMNVQLAPGQAASLELAGSTLVTKLGQRAEVQPVVSASNGGCIASAEVFINGLGTTSTFFPVDPCSPSSSSCTAF